MKKFGALVFAVLLVVLTGCGVTSATKSDESVSASATESNGSVSMPETKGYPWNTFYSLSWVVKDNNGYLKDFSMIVYEPQPLTEDYLFPQESFYRIKKDDSQLDVWAIPFCVTIQNSTYEQGLGSAPFLACFGVGKTQSGGGLLPSATLMSFGPDKIPEHRRENGGFFEIVLFEKDGSTSSWDGFVGRKGEIPRGSRLEEYGYMLFVDKRKTPNSPLGTDNASFFEPSDGTRYMFGLGDTLSSSRDGVGYVTRGPSFKKDDEGNLVLWDEENHIYTFGVPGEEEEQVDYSWMEEAIRGKWDCEFVEEDGSVTPFELEYMDDHVYSLTAVIDGEVIAHEGSYRVDEKGHLILDEESIPTIFEINFEDDLNGLVLTKIFSSEKIKWVCKRAAE